MRTKISAACSGVFSLTKDDFRSAFAQGAVMVDAGVAEILLGQILQTGQGFVDGDAALAGLFLKPP